MSTGLASLLMPEAEDYRDHICQDLRFAVIGFGKMGILHSAILNLLAPNSVRAVVDKSRLLTLGASKLMKSPKFYRNARDMLKTEDPNVVYVTTPAQSHCAIVSELVETGVRYIFVEKPPTTNSDELMTVIDKMQSNQLVMVGFQKRYSLPFRHARMLLSNSIIGDIEEVHAQMKSSDILAPTTRFDQLGKGVLLDSGVHLVDLLVWIFGTCTTEKSSCRSIHTHVDDYVKAALRTRDGAQVSLEVTWSSPEHRLPETLLEIHGSGGELRVTEDYLKVNCTESHPLLGDEAQLERYKPDYYRSLPPVNLADPEYALENIHFLFSINSFAEPLTSLRSTYQTMELLDELYRKASE